MTNVERLEAAIDCVLNKLEGKFTLKIEQKLALHDFSIDCIKEMDVTSVTSPIGLWTTPRKSIVSNLGSA